jgi:hypothetical protein
MYSPSTRTSQSTSEAGLAWASVIDAHGRQYFTDEFNHRVVVEDITGRTWSFGQPGPGAGDLRFPRGLALESAATPEATRVFVADTWNHRVQVFDGTGRLCFAFGGRGDKDGQFSAPADLVIARPELPWEGDGNRRQALPVLVVADQWNGRLQVFGLDGVWLSTIGGRNSSRSEPGVTEQSCPFFRMGGIGVPRDPVRLSWRSPWLIVVGSNGREYRIDLAAALLPTFAEWLQTAPPAERAHARRYFSLSRHGRADTPAAVLQALSIEPGVA